MQAIREIAKVAFEVHYYLYSTVLICMLASYICQSSPCSQTNKTVENIGARRLHTIIERIVEEIR